MTVREEAQWCIRKDGMLAEIRKKIRSGKADYEDTAAYSARAGKMIGALFSRRLPEIPPEEREQLCVELLHDQYIDINAAVDAAQRYLDERLGIQLAPQHAPFDSERGHQIGSSLRDLSKPVETLQRRARAATETTVKSMHDDRMKTEAKFRSRAGLNCFITRKAVSGCCAWCTAMAGRYAYGEEPDDIYRRHDNCDCTVTFENGRKRQDVWSKREWEAPKEGAGAGEPVRLNKSKSAELYEKHKLKSLTSDEEHGKIKEKKYVPATQQEIQQFVADMQSLGFASVKGFEQFSERASLLKEITEDFETLHRDFPEIFASLHLNFEQTKTLGEKAYAEYDPVLRRITLSPFFYNDLDFMKKKYESDLLDNFHPKGTTYRAIIPHEFGHAVTDYYGIKEKQLAKQIYSETHEMHFTRKLGDDWIISGLCTYASEFHYGEIVSESFAEYYSSANPRDLCKKIVDFCLGERVK